MKIYINKINIYIKVLNMLMDIRTFIKSQNCYEFYTFEDWFHDLYFDLMYDKDILITPNILKLLYSSKFKLNNYEDIREATLQLKEVSKKHDIEFEEIETSSCLLKEYPHIQDINITDWVIMNIKEFKKTLMLVPDIRAADKYFYFEEIINKYKKYIAEEEHKKYEEIVVHITKKLFTI